MENLCNTEEQRMKAKLGINELDWFYPSKYNGQLRKKQIYVDKTLLAWVEAEPGTEDVLHTHPNEQLGYVLQGRLEFKVGDIDKTIIFEPGDFWGFKSDFPHGIKVIEKAVFITLYTPPKDEKYAVKLG